MENIEITVKVDYTLNELLDYLNMRHIVNKELIRLNPQRKSIAMSLCKHDTIDYSFINKKKLIIL